MGEIFPPYCKINIGGYMNLSSEQILERWNILMKIIEQNFKDKQKID